MAGAATAQNIANTLWALAALQAEPSMQEGQAALPQQQQQQQGPGVVPQEVVQVLVDAFMQQLQYSNCQEVANTLWAAAKLQYCAPSHQLCLLVGHITGQQEALDLQSMQLQSEAAAQAAAAGTGGVVRQSGPDSSDASAATASSAGAHVHKQQAVPIKPAEAVGILWSVAAMQQLHAGQHQQQASLLPHDQVQQLLTSVLEQRHSSVQEVAGACFAAARMEPSVVPAALLRQDTLAFIASQVNSMNLQVRC
jgi:hypothetical protein